MIKLKAYSYDDMIDGKADIDLKYYPKEDADTVIAELKQKLAEKESLVKMLGEWEAALSLELEKIKQKLEDAKATAYTESVDAGMENRKLKRALYKACAKLRVLRIDTLQKQPVGHFQKIRKGNDKMKYKITKETKIFLGKTLHRIVCVTAFANVSAGDTGGWIESEKNLDQNGNAWVYDNALVYGDAQVYDNALVSGNARVYGNARVEKIDDYTVLKNTWSSGRFFTYTASNKKWAVGCFYGTGEELIKKAYADSDLAGKCYEASVKYVEEIERIKGESA